MFLPAAHENDDTDHTHSQHHRLRGVKLLRKAHDGHSGRGARRVAANRSTSRRLIMQSLENRQLLAFDVMASYETAVPASVLLVDVDTGSQVDMVAVSQDSVRVRLGNADGSFGESILSATSAGASSVGAGDFTGDQITDLITVHPTHLSLLVGNGDGTFQSPQVLSLPAQTESTYTGLRPIAQSPLSVASGDLNDDGELDLVVGSSTSFPFAIYCGYYSCAYAYTYNGYVNVLIGNGSGGFAAPQVHPLGAYRWPTAMNVVDLNNDDHADVISGDQGVSVLLGDGTGAVGTPIQSGFGTFDSSIPLGDIDGDGDLDVVSRNGDFLNLHEGQGDGSFVSTTQINAEQRVHSVVMGDVNADGSLDLVAAGAAPCSTYGYYGWCYDPVTTRQASVLLGNGEGSFSLPIPSTLGTTAGSLLIDIAITDLTGDGFPELIALDHYAGSTIVADNDRNWQAPGELSISDASIVEGNSGLVNAIFTVTRMGNLQGEVIVDFATADSFGIPALAGTDYLAQTGTLNFGPNVLTQTITVQVNGDRLGEGDETFHVNLSNASGALIRDSQGVGTIHDDEPGIRIDHTWDMDPLMVTEGDTGTTPAVFHVMLTQSYDQEVTVDYYTVTGNTADIIEASGTLRFSPGQTSQEITVQVVGDLWYEDLEAFNVYLANPSANAFILRGDGYCYIVDNDPLPTVSIEDVTRSEGNRGTTSFDFVLQLSAANFSGAWVEFATSDVTATSGKDYVATTGTVYFDPGQTIATIRILVQGDKTGEANETFHVNLVDTWGASIADGQGVGTILNDDRGFSPPSLRVSDALLIEGDSGTSMMTFVISLSQASPDSVSVDYRTNDQTAKASNNDYVASSGRLSFAPGELTKNVTIIIHGDTTREKDETFYVVLSGALNATIADSKGVGKILNDDARFGRRSSTSFAVLDSALLELLSGSSKKRSR